MGKYKEYKKVIKQVHIDNQTNFSNNLESFLNRNPDIKIITTILHKPYHITIIYEVLIHQPYL